MSEKAPPQTMAFHHSEGFVPAWNQAMRFAGDHGRIATLPDLIDARMATKPGAEPWEMYFTMLSAEYFGLGRDGRRKIIVAHGVGPMSTLDGILKAYSWEFKDKSRDRRGGRISREDFWKLERGEYGEVQIVDFDSYVSRYRYPFLGHLRFSQIAMDPLFRARLGSRALEYLGRHLEEARQWHAAQAGFDPENTYKLQGHAEFCDRRRAMHVRMSRPDSDPYLIQIGDAANCGYMHHRLEAGQAMGHLLSISQLMHLHHSEEESEFRQYESLTCDVSCHEWWNGVRLLGNRSGGQVCQIHSGVTMVSDLIETHWRELMRPTHGTRVGFRPLMKVGDRWFTQYQKSGAGLDTHEPEFLVIDLKPMGEAMEFVTPTLGYHGFFKYDIRGVHAMAPAGANAYALVSDPEIIWSGGNPNHQHVLVQFYHIQIDAKQRLRRAKDLENDYDTLMKLLGSESASA